MLDLFAVPADLRALPGGQGGSVLAGDLVLSPGRDAVIADALSPVVARLAVTLDTRPKRRPRDLRIAMPIPARDGSWTVEGWSASRYEPGTVTCSDPAVVRAAGALLHAEFASAVTDWPLSRQEPRHRWDRAERAAFGPDTPDLGSYAAGQAALAADLLALRDGQPIGPAQLVHADLAGNVLLDGAGAPVVIDVAPYWRPMLWADAVCVLDLVRWFGADPGLLRDWTAGARRQAMIRAAVFRVLSDIDPDVERYRCTLESLLGK
ncbi:aminoglycoside phosphotransferase [Flexivirga caeni]|uniref:aminoglycoside phosphotransferase n=1 Tax=Flexivirga caeni TaxID=2294115 RepID=UPI001FE8BED2|nr:aminoglycoside phosphotransferase [Flexivirga caeni]